MSNLEIFNLENFVLHYNSILCFCNPRNIYHKNTESHESTKILTLEIFRLYGIRIPNGCIRHIRSTFFHKNTPASTVVPQARPYAAGRLSIGDYKRPRKLDYLHRRVYILGHFVNCDCYETVPYILINFIWINRLKNTLHDSGDLALIERRSLKQQRDKLQ